MNVFKWILFFKWILVRRSCQCCAVGLTFLAALPIVTQAATIRTVALTGQQAPGTASGVSYLAFDPPALNDAGQTAFLASLTGLGVVDYVNHGGVWSEGSGSLALVARLGDHAPGTPDGVNFGVGFISGGFDFPTLNNAGQTAFWAGLTGDGVDPSNNRGIWSEASGSLALVARSGNQAPGMPSGANFVRFERSPAVNSAARIAFKGGVTETGGVTVDDNEGIWSDSLGSLTLVAREGQPAPGAPSGASFVNLGLPVLNDIGQTAFWANVTVVGSSIWSEGSGSLRLVAQPGGQAPDLPNGVVFGGFENPVLNNLGQMALRARVTGSGVDETNDAGIWLGGTGTVALVAREGNPAPGTASGVNFGSFISGHLPARPALNNTGQMAFRAFLTGSGIDETNNSGIWLGDSSALALVVRKGTQAPGAPIGVNFDHFDPPVLNDAGQAAFGAFITDGGNNQLGGIWATDLGGTLHLVALTGDQLEVAPGDFRTIESLDFQYKDRDNERRSVSGFNNFGQLAFSATFTDGSWGVFVSNRVATLAGDYNADGSVDAADYVLWRKTGGTHEGYDTWRANFGATAGRGAAGFPLGASADPLSAAVPEPATLALLIIAAAIGSRRQRG